VRLTGYGCAIRGPTCDDQRLEPPRLPAETAGGAARTEARVPQPNLAQLVLVELAAAAAAGGIALAGGLHGAGFIAGVAVAALVLIPAIVPLRGRWLYQLGQSWLGLRLRRRRSTTGSGLAGLLGDYRVESVAAGSRGGVIGVVHSGTTWSLPLALGLDSVFNDDVPVPLHLLADLLNVEDVPLSSVRLFTLVTPAQTSGRSPAGPAAPATPLAARYCLITLDSLRAADAIAARGGGTLAVHQILRRCAVHAEQELATAGLTVRRLDENAVASLFATWLGPATTTPTRRGEHPEESWIDVRVAGTWSTVFAISGQGDDVVDRVARLAALAPTPVVGTSLVLQPVGARGRIEATMLVRLSAPASVARADALSALTLLAQAFDLDLKRVDGEQATLLRATTPLGVGEPV
jgi:type VII secretion protein EccE